jgi:hypothetical protein
MANPLVRTLRSMVTAPVRAFAEPKMLGTLLAANLVVGLLISLPSLLPTLQGFGHSLLGRGAPFPSTPALFEANRALSNGGAFMGGSMVLAVVLSLLMQLYFAGGMTSRLWSAGRFVFSEFASQSARLWGRNVRLFGWSLVGLIPAAGFAVGSALLMKALHKPTLFTLKNEEWILGTPLTGWSAAHLGLSLFVLAGWRASLDVARVQLFSEDQRKTRVAAWRAVKRVVTSPGQWLAYAVLAAAGAMAVIGSAKLHGLIPVQSAAGAWLALLVAQGVIFVRLGCSVATLAFAVEVHRATPAPSGPGDRSKTSEAVEIISDVPLSPRPPPPPPDATS